MKGDKPVGYRTVISWNFESIRTSVFPVTTDTFLYNSLHISNIFLKFVLKIVHFTL